MVARAALNSGKRAVVAGPGNPPVVVDDSADLDRAARSIIQGAAFDNNLLCIAEKEVFVVDQVFDQLMAAMERAGAVRLNSREIDQLTQSTLHRNKGQNSCNLVLSLEGLLPLIQSRAVHHSVVTPTQATEIFFIVYDCLQVWHFRSGAIILPTNWL